MLLLLVQELAGKGASDNVATGSSCTQATTPRPRRWPCRSTVSILVLACCSRAARAPTRPPLLLDARERRCPAVRRTANPRDASCSASDSVSPRTPPALVRHEPDAAVSAGEYRDIVDAVAAATVISMLLQQNPDPAKGCCRICDSASEWLVGELARRR